MPMDRIPIVATAADFPSAISAISDDNASGRWYLMRRSIQLGCEDQVPEEWLDGLTAAYNGDRKEAADKGIALPDGSFPIPNRNYLERAIQAYGRASDKPRAKAHIIKRARALNAMSLIPDGWKGGDSAMAASAFAPDEVFYEFLYDDAVSGAVLSIDDWATGYSDMRHVVSDIETCAVMASAYGQDLDWEQQIGEYLDATVAGGNIDEDDYQTVLEALVAAVRHVRTEEGSRFYGEPIGAVIVKDTYIPHGSKMVGDLKSGDFFRFGNKNVQVQASGPGPNGTTRVSVRDTADFDAPPTSWDLISGKPVQTLQRIRADAKASLGAETPKRSLKDRLTGKGKNVEDPTAKIISGTDAKLGRSEEPAKPEPAKSTFNEKTSAAEAASAKANAATSAIHGLPASTDSATYSRLYGEAADLHDAAAAANTSAGNHNIAANHESRARAHNDRAAQLDARVARHPIVPEAGPSKRETDTAAAHEATQTAHINSLSGQSDAKTSAEHAAASKAHVNVDQTAAAEAHRVSSASYQSSQTAANYGTAADHEKAADLHRLAGAMHGEMNGEDHKGIAAAHKIREADHREQADKAIKANSSEHKVVLTGNQSINLTTGKVTEPDGTDVPGTGPRELKRGETVSLNQTVKEQAAAKAAASKPSDKALSEMSREELRAEVNKFEPGTPARRAVVEEQMRRANERNAPMPKDAAEEFPTAEPKKTALPDLALTGADRKKLVDEGWNLTDTGVPYAEDKGWSREDALSHSKDRGDLEKVRADNKSKLDAMNAKPSFVTGKHTKLGEVRKDATRGDEHHTIPKESLGDGHVPSVGDGVKTSDGKEGTIKRTYQLYSEVEFKDGSKKVVRNTKLNTTGEVKVAQTTKSGRARAVSSGNAMPDGSFPIEDKTALAKAIKAVGRSKDPEAARKHITAMAKKLGVPEAIPAGWAQKDGGVSDGSASKPTISGLNSSELHELSGTLRPRAKAGNRNALLKKATEDQLQSLYDNAMNRYLHTQDDQNAHLSVVNRIRAEMKRRGMSINTSAQYRGQN